MKLYLLPDKSRSGKRKSNAQKNELNPKFDQKFTFGPIQLAEFEFRTLWLSVWHKDRGLARNEFLGELLIPLSFVQKQLLSACGSQLAAKWYALQDLRQKPQQLQVSRRRQSQCPFWPSNKLIFSRV